MRKQEYIFELEKALKTAHVKDSQDILEEYEQHFDLKIADGYSEEEIAAKLAAPKDIAQEFQGVGEKSKGRNRLFLIPGIICADICAGSFFILLYAWVFVLGALSLASATAGICIVTRLDMYNIIPYMPIHCAILFGFSILALALLSVMGTIYCYLYSTQLLRVYIRWHKSNCSGHFLPPLPMHPSIQPKLRRRMRSVTLTALAVFAVGFIVSYICMTISAGSFEFWHVWNWFV